MRRLDRVRPSPAGAIAVVALFVALGGTAIAVNRNSVGSKEIKRAAVKSVDLKNDGVKGKDVDETTLAGVGQGAVMGRIEGLGANAFEFGSPSGTSSAAGSTAGVEYVSPVSGTAEALTVHLTNAMPANSGLTFFLAVNGEDSPLACGISNGSDCTSGKRSAKIQAGDRLAIGVVPAGEPPPGTDALFGWQLSQ